MNEVIILVEVLLVLRNVEVECRLQLSCSDLGVLLVTCSLLCVHHHDLVVAGHLLRFGQVILQQGLSIYLASFLNVEQICHLALHLSSK